MSERERALARLFARLGSIPLPTEGMTAAELAAFHRDINRERVHAAKHAHPDHALVVVERRASGLERLAERDRAKLERDLVRLSSFAQHLVKSADPPISPADLRRWSRMLAEDQLPWIHERVRRCFIDLFSGSPVDLRRLLEPRRSTREQPTTRLWLIDGELKEMLEGAAPHEHPLGDFLSILRLRPFPFGRCPVCSNVYVRVRRQRYCSLQCTSRGVEAARKGKRREYMRELMRKRRERDRLLKLKSLRAARSQRGSPIA